MVVGKCPLRAVGGGDPAALVLGGGRGGPVWWQHLQLRSGSVINFTNSVGHLVCPT